MFKAIEQYGNMTNQQIYFSGAKTRFVHTGLGLICEIWMFFYLLFALFPLMFNYCRVQNMFTLQFITYSDVVFKVATTAILIQTRGVQSMFSMEKTINTR